MTTALVDEGVMGVCVAGEVDLDTAGQVANAVRNAVATGPREVHLDMAAVTFLDSSGIRTLLHAQEAAAEQKVVLRVVKAHRRGRTGPRPHRRVALLQDGASSA